MVITIPVCILFFSANISCCLLCLNIASFCNKSCCLEMINNDNDDDDNYITNSYNNNDNNNNTTQKYAIFQVPKLQEHLLLVLIYVLLHNLFALQVYLNNNNNSDSNDDNDNDNNDNSVSNDDNDNNLESF